MSAYDLHRIEAKVDKLAKDVKSLIADKIASLTAEDIQDIHRNELGDNPADFKPAVEGSGETFSFEQDMQNHFGPNWRELRDAETKRKQAESRPAPAATAETGEKWEPQIAKTNDGRFPPQYILSLPSGATKEQAEAAAADLALIAKHRQSVRDMVFNHNKELEDESKQD